MFIQKSYISIGCLGKYFFEKIRLKYERTIILRPANCSKANKILHKKSAMPSL